MRKSSKRYSPNVYIKTTSGALLAFLKFVELAAGIWLLYNLIKVDFSVTRFFDESIEALAAFSGTESAGFSHLLNEELHLMRYVDGVSLVGLCVWIIDSISVILLRLTGRFSGLIRLIHTLICVIMVVAIIASIIGIVGMYYGLYKFESDGELTTYFRSFSFAFAALGVAGCGLTFGYHSGIAGIMKTIGIERRTGERRSVRRSGLPGICVWLAFITLIPILLTLVHYLITIWPEMPAHRQIRNVMEWLRAIGLVETETIPTLICSFFFIEMLTVCACAKKYNREHHHESD